MLSNTIRGIVVAGFAAAVVGVPAFELWKGSVLNVADVGGFSWSAIRTGEAARVTEAALDREVVLPELCRPYYNEAMYAAFGVTTDQVLLGRDGWMFYANTIRDYPRAEDLERLPEVVDVLSGFSRWLESEGIAFTLVLVPNKASLIPDAVPRTHPPFRPVYEESVARLRAAGIDTVNLAAALKKDGEPLYFKGDTHWRPEGAAAAAFAVRDHLMKRFGDDGWPGERVALEIKQRGEPVLWEGGLLRMLGIREDGRLHERLMESKEVLDAWVPGARAPIVFDASERIVLYGTSFSQGYKFANLCAAALSRRIENNVAEGIGATFPIMEHAQRILRGERARPEMIVWEFPERFLYISPSNMIDPTRAVVEATRFDPARATALDGRSAKITDMVMTGETVAGLTKVRATSSRARVRFACEDPLPGDGSVAVVYTVATARRTLVRIRLFTADGADGEAFTVTTVGHDAEQMVCYPLVTASGKPVKEVEVGFVTPPAFLRLSSVEVWPVRQP